MKPASRVKFYFARYFFLAFGMLQALAAMRMLWLSGEIPVYRIAAFIFLCTTGISLWVQFAWMVRLRRVNVGKKKIVVKGEGHERTYRWDDVKSMEALACFDFYRLKLKGRRSPIYFITSKG
ncbi:MAG: hypothetical protein U0V64_12250 [Cyclobacteriaceae bacterium]